MSLRPAEPGDAQAVTDIWCQGWNDGHLGNVPDELVAIRTEESFHARAAERVGDIPRGTLSSLVPVVSW